MRSVLGSPGNSLTKEWSHLSSSSLSRGLSLPSTGATEAEATGSESMVEEATAEVPSPQSEAIPAVRLTWRLSCCDRKKRRCGEGEEKRGVNLEKQRAVVEDEKRRGEKWRSIAFLSLSHRFYFLFFFCCYFFLILTGSLAWIVEMEG